MLQCNQHSFFTHISYPHFGEQAEKLRAVSAVLAAGLYYLNIYAEHNGGVFSGIDLKIESGREAIKEAVSFLINKTYEGL